MQYLQAKKNYVTFYWRVTSTRFILANEFEWNGRQKQF